MAKKNNKGIIYTVVVGVLSIVGFYSYKNWQTIVSWLKKK